MAKLTPEELKDRLRLDHRVVMDMRGEIMEVQTFSTQPNTLAEKNPQPENVDGALARFYRVKYHIKTLIDKGKYRDSTTVLIDVGDDNYPFSEPMTAVLDRPVPWSPHFRAGDPICLDTIWRDAHGKDLLGTLLVHIAKLLNFDEVARGGGYEGWNGEAQAYWVHELKAKPITLNLKYPVLPKWAYGQPEGPSTTSRFRPKLIQHANQLVGSPSGFKPSTPTRRGI